jgi:hypothetical protein
MPLPHGEPPPRLAGTQHAVPPHNKESHTRTVCLLTTSSPSPEPGPVQAEGHRPPPACGAARPRGRETGFSPHLHG